jgi:hypothetical protein
MRGALPNEAHPGEYLVHNAPATGVVAEAEEDRLTFCCGF